MDHYPREAGMSPPSYPHDPKRLLREVNAAIRLRDIEEWHRLRDAVAFQWWESALLALLFISGVGILVTIAKLIPDQPRLLYYFILGWSVLWILTLIACVEFLILKFRALRRMHEITERHLRKLDEEFEELHRRLDPIAETVSGEPTGPEGSSAESG